MSTTRLTSLQNRKQRGEKFAVITAYDAAMAQAVARAGIEVILVGDSLGMTVQGHDSTLPVTVADMAYHTGCVSRAVQGPLIIADMPYGSYNTPEAAMENGASLMRAGAHMVKLEGGAWLFDSIRRLTERGTPVCAHLGLTPQSVNLTGGYRIQGRDEADAQRIHEDALGVQEAGARLLVLECVPRQLAASISEALHIPVIGIGAGPGTDAQVLVIQDLLGLTVKPARFVQNFMTDADSIDNALISYREAVENSTFPGDQHSFE